MPDMSKHTELYAGIQEGRSMFRMPVGGGAPDAFSPTFANVIFR
jgi:hypothetical protein